MTAVDFDPYRAEIRLNWSNRWVRWRADAAQTTFHVLAAVALLAMLALPVFHVLDDLVPLAREALHRWPWSLALLTVSALSLRQAQQLATLRAHQAQAWLAAMPVAAWIQQRRQRDCVLREALLHGVVGLSALSIVDAGAMAATSFVACVLVAALAGLPLSRYLARRSVRSGAADVRFAAAGRGRLWRWQRIEAGAALRGRSLSFGFWALLLVPMGSGPIGVIAVASAGLLLAMLSTAWTRSLKVLPQAQSWLASQPLSGTKLLRATWVVPCLTLLIVAGLIGAALAALSASALAVLAALAIIGLGGLQWACVAATRAHPRRASLELLVHITLLVAVVQVMPPLIVPCWALQMAMLLRRAARP